MKSLERIRRDPRVAGAWIEGEDGYWVDLQRGWRSSDGTTSLHEHTIRDLRAQLSMVRRETEEDR